MLRKLKNLFHKKELTAKEAIIEPKREELSFTTSDVIAYYEYVHDNEINSYEVNFIDNTIKFHTIYPYEMKELTDIVFEGVLAHDFENVIQTNIISCIYQMSIPCFINEYSEMLINSLRYAFPTEKVRNIEQLQKFLVDKAYKIFQIHASMGLVGFIISNDIKVIVDGQVVNQ